MRCIVDESKVYSARMTGNQFLYKEFKVAVELQLEGLSRSEATERIIAENLFGYRSMKAINKHIGAVWERASYCDDSLKQIVMTSPNEIGRVVNFYSILKYDLLFLEFVESVIYDKLNTHQYVLTRGDISDFFSKKANYSDIVQNFKDSTLKRLRLAYFEVLTGAGYLNKNSSNEMELTVPIAVQEVTDHIEAIGDKRYSNAMLGR